MAYRMIEAGRLRDRIRFERKVASAAFDGAGQEQWVPVDTVWAEVQDVLPSRAETMDDGLSIANRPARIRIRYRTDIDAAMRIIHGARVMEIIAGPAEIGWREGLELMAQDYSTAGPGL